MADSGIFMGWNRPATGQDRNAFALNERLTTYMRTLHAEGRIDSFETVMLGAHGGDLGGFVLIRGEREKLDRIRSSREFRELTVRGSAALLGFRVVRAHFGAEVGEILKLYAQIASEG